MLDHAVEERFLKQENRGLVLARDSVVGLLQALEEWRLSGVNYSFPSTTTRIPDGYC